MPPPFTLQLEPFVTEVAEPAQGRARLEYHASMEPPLRIGIEAPPWASTGRQPFAWDMSLIPGGPVITLALDRAVRLRWNEEQWRSSPLPTYAAGPRGIQQVTGPVLTVIRLQDSALIPPPETALQPHQLVRPPYPWWTADVEEDAPIWWARAVATLAPSGPFSNREATVYPTPDGLLVTHTGGEWEFAITVPRGEPAAIAYEIYFPQPFGYFMRLVRTPNVRIRGRLTRDYAAGVSQVFLRVATMRSLASVPPQGTPLDERRFRFEYWSRFEVTLSARARQEILVMETVIGVIPIVGTLYDVAHVIYAGSTGRTFWGERVTDEEIALMGACAIVSVIPEAGGVLRALGRVARSRPPLRVLGEASIAERVRRRVDPRVLDAVESLPAAERRTIEDVLDGYAAGARSAREVVQAVTEAVAPRVRTFVEEEQALRRLFSEDLTGFRDAELAEGYRRYLARAQRGQRRLNPLEWARAQRPGSRYHELLIREVGPEYRDVIGRLIRRPVIREMTPEALRVLEQVGHVAEEYGSLRRHTRGVGHLLEVDHLLERRFRNSPRWDDVAIHDDDLVSMVVPRDPQVARQISGYQGYVHTVKTSLLKRLIPHGAEDVFTTQQWWDAHVFAYRALGIDESILRGRFREQFEAFVELSGRTDPIEYRFTQRAEDFLPSSGWPVVLRD